MLCKRPLESSELLLESLNSIIVWCLSAKLNHSCLTLRLAEVQPLIPLIDCVKEKTVITSSSSKNRYQWYNYLKSKDLFVDFFFFLLITVHPTTITIPVWHKRNQNHILKAHIDARRKVRIKIIIIKKNVA